LKKALCGLKQAPR